MTTSDRGSDSLARSIHESKAARARAMDPAEKFLAGPRLFEMVRERMLCGIRDRHTEWGEAAVEAEFGRQMAAIRAREERGIYTPVPQDAIDGGPTGAP
jgi:hypothetical protein